MPIVRTKKAMDQLDNGDSLKVLATDPGAVADFQAWTHRTGHKLLSSEEVNHEFHFLLEKVEKNSSNT
jgi:tRNA 2-thiouridine synthesizing protein A